MNFTSTMMEELYNTTEGFFSTTMMNITSEALEVYPNISDDPATEIMLALISVSVAVIVLFCYVRDMIASGVCKKGFRHYDENSLKMLEEKLLDEIDASAKETNKSD